MNLEHLKTTVNNLRTARLQALQDYLDRPDCLELNTKLIKLEKELKKYVYLEELAKYEEHLKTIEEAETFDELFDYAEMIFQRNKKIKDKIVHQKIRFRKRLLQMQNPYFITITFTDESLTSDFRRKIREYFKREGISFCLVSDYGTQGTKRFHFHGIVDIPFDKQGKYYNQTLLRKINAKARHAKSFSMLWLEANIGWNSLSPIKRTDKEIQKHLKYCFKYIYKNPDREIFASRTYKKTF